MEEKYGKAPTSRASVNGSRTKADDTESSNSSTVSEEEDDEGVLISENLDDQIQKTLEAIRKKDPRVYDESSRFYTEPEDDVQSDTTASNKKEKPMFLSDYHRRNLLDGIAPADSPTIEPLSFSQQQDHLKDVIVKEMHATGNREDGSDPDQIEEDTESEDFLVPAATARQEDAPLTQMKPKRQELNIEAAGKDPDTYLTKFMSAKAWIPSDSSRFQPFESDDEEDERRAELFEEAYNLRFEDPQTSNEKLLSHARDAAARYSVRKESTNPRKKAREAERAKKELAKQSREEEKARLRKLKIAEIEDKLEKIKEASGLQGPSLDQDDWSAFLEEVWDDSRWEELMNRRFGNEYYAATDTNGSHQQEGMSKRKMKKPKWKDDIDISDLIPDVDAAENEEPHLELQDDKLDVVKSTNANVDDGDDPVDEEFDNFSSKNETTKEYQKAEQKIARQERRKIETLVDSHMGVDEKLMGLATKGFRYRDTSPTAFGLTANDILMASDSQLNQYAGLKKIATFRDPDRKRKDKKHLGKKARLRQWRKETFGNVQGPQMTLAEILGESEMGGNRFSHTSIKDNGTKEKRKRTRVKKSKRTGNN